MATVTKMTMNTVTKAKTKATKSDRNEAWGRGYAAGADVVDAYGSALAADYLAGIAAGIADAADDPALAKLG